MKSRTAVITNENGQSKRLPAMLRGRVSASFKDDVRKYCAANDVNESQLVRLAVKEAMAKRGKVKAA